MGLSGNKGEWSEIYVLLYLLGTARLYSANERLELLDENAFFQILSIFREEGKEANRKKIRYDINDVATRFVSVYVNGEHMVNLATEVLKSEAIALFDAIVSNNQGDRAFEISSSNAILNALNCSTLKAPSDDKTDIALKLHDFLTGYTRKCGFSIKSQLGGDPTLLNAGQTTNFKYEIIGMTDDLAKQINQVEGTRKIIKRLKMINSSNAKLKFCCAVNRTFSENLMLVDSRMEEIVGEILLRFYQDRANKCKEAVELLEEDNPLHFPREGFYAFKFKKLLCSVALGMVPGSIWNGQDDANGGYIIVKQDGDVLAYHLYNRNSFENYLLNNTRFETASTSRHQFGSVYNENGKFFVDLNLQIRFIS